MQIIRMEPAIGPINGVNRDFSGTLPFAPHSVRAFVNGQAVHDFAALSATTIRLAHAPLPGDTVNLYYMVSL